MIKTSFSIFLILITITFSQTQNNSNKNDSGSQQSINKISVKRQINSIINQDSLLLHMLLSKSKIVLSEKNNGVYKIFKDIIFPLIMFLLGLLGSSIIIFIQKGSEKKSIEKMILVELKLNFTHINALTPEESTKTFSSNAMQILSEGYEHISTSIYDAYFNKLNLLNGCRLEKIIIVYRSINQYIKWSEKMRVSYNKLIDMLKELGLDDSTQENLEKLPTNEKAKLELYKNGTVKAIQILHKNLRESIENFSAHAFLKSEQGKKSVVINKFNI